MTSKEQRPGYVKLIAGLYLLELIVIFIAVVGLDVIGVFNGTILILTVILLIVLFALFFGTWKGIKPFWYLALAIGVLDILSFSSSSIIGLLVGSVIVYALFRTDVKQWFNIEYRLGSQTKPAKFIAILIVLVVIGIAVSLINPKGAYTTTPSPQNLASYCNSQPPGYSCKNLSLNTQTFSAMLDLPYSNYSYPPNDTSLQINNRYYNCTPTNFGHGGNFTITCPVSSIGITKGESYTGSIMVTVNTLAFENRSPPIWTFTVNAT